MDILSLLTHEPLNKYKLHAGRYNGEDQPLDVFIKSRDDWLGWNSWYGTRHEANRPYILSLIDFYPERNAWLFGGVFEVGNYQTRPTEEAKNSRAYDVRLLPVASGLIGRLKLSLSISRGRMFNLENHAHKIKLIEVMRGSYTGPPFPGYDSVSLKFNELVSIVNNNRQDWKTALENMKGIYVITLGNGKLYIGSASGTVGMWSRWSNYVYTGHGGNKQMKALHEASRNYLDDAVFTLIEAWPMRTDDSHILRRETFWKNALSSRSHGINSN